MDKPALRKWKCHKVVEAAKIASVHHGKLLLEVADGAGGQTEVLISDSWDARHKPQPGGYFVRYDDGYESYSPAKAFEEGYTPLAPQQLSYPGRAPFIYGNPPLGYDSVEDALDTYRRALDRVTGGPERSVEALQAERLRGIREAEARALDALKDEQPRIAPVTENRLLRYFAFEHLPLALQALSKPFAELAHYVARVKAHDGAEQTVALRKLLEAKDAAVRMMLPPK